MISNHFILGCPSSFDLPQQISSAKSVKIAVAFAKKSGWNTLKRALLSRKKTVEIIVGLNFGITDAELLDEWLSIQEESPEHFSVRIALRRPTFHPKVVIAQFENGRHLGIVGSGNLTAGGQGVNIECGVYITKGSHIEELEQWFGRLKTVPLNEAIVDAYRPVNERAREQSSGSGVAGPLDKLLGRHESGWYSDLFALHFREFVASDSGCKALKGRVSGARKIQSALKIPKLNFTREGWQEFYRIPEFGKIRMAYPEMVDDMPALRRTLKLLVEKSDEPEEFRSIFERKGKNHIYGMGINQISKVLTVFKRDRWPVLNKPVWATLRNYGYNIGWSATDYLKFAHDMKTLLRKTGPVDFWALDAFCKAKSQSFD